MIFRATFALCISLLVSISTASVIPDPFTDMSRLPKDERSATDVTNSAIVRIGEFPEPSPGCVPEIMAVAECEQMIQVIQEKITKEFEKAFKLYDEYVELEKRLKELEELYRKSNTNWLRIAITLQKALIKQKDKERQEAVDRAIEFNVQLVKKEEELKKRNEVLEECLDPLNFFLNRS